MKKLNLVRLMFLSLCLTQAATLAAQVEESKIDSVKVSASEKDVDNRNVMLNASANTGPRNVNIGLPASVGGTTILENGLPVVYFFWPEFPISAWRRNASHNRMGLLKLGESAITIGDVGFAVDSYTNMGTPEFQGNGFISSNHFGLLNGSVNVSGPLRNDFFYTATAYLNYDPGTFDLGFNKWIDQTQLYNAGITKKYNSGKGEIGVLYKYMNTRGLTQNFAPFIYEKDGKVKELGNFRMGRDSYHERSGKLSVEDVLTGEKSVKDVIDDYSTASHTIDLLGKNVFDNGMTFNYIVRYHNAKASSYLPAPIGVIPTDAQPDVRYLNQDGSPYTGENVQQLLALASSKTPINSLTSKFELTGKAGVKKQHSWRLGLNEFYYHINKFQTSSSIYYHTIEPQPMRLIMQTYYAGNDTWVNATDENNIALYNTGMEYHNGSENKLAVYATDSWDISSVLSLNLGARLEYQTLRGDYYPHTPAPDDFIGDNPTTDINKDWLNKAFTANAVYKITRTFGLLGELTYNEQAGHLENYSGAVDPDVKQSRIPGGSLGVFFNYDKVSIVSQVTYIQRSNYRKRLNLTNPDDPSDVFRQQVGYNIQTFGWTTDIVTTPFKNFSLHFLFTIQKPEYNDYSFTAFGNNYSYDGKIVEGVPETLIEIDPSYTLLKNKMRIWASARYFSKQYANPTNALYFASRWETFAGVDYKINKNISAAVTVVNLLNERGAQGTISGAELITDPSEYYGQVLTGTYIRPFTVEFGMNFNF